MLGLMNLPANPKLKLPWPCPQFGMTKTNEQWLSASFSGHLVLMRGHGPIDEISIRCRA